MHSTGDSRELGRDGPADVEGERRAPSGGSVPQQAFERLRQDNARLQQQLELVKKEQTEYLQNVSHQLVAPLNATKWHIENLTAGRLTSEDRVRKVLRSIYSQSTLAVHLAKNFALMSNLEADHALSALREPLEPIDLCQLMVNLADDFQPLGWDKALSITVIDHPLREAPQVLAIKPLISQVFSNIIENAVKYSDKGTEISIGGIHNPKDGTVSVSITNRGIPLPVAETEKVFERGYRSPGAKNLYPAGTGFGMYIAKRIMDIHEGTIQARNAETGRVTFTVTLSVSKLKGKARQRDAKDGSHNR
jgi:signal transduction histidine kinase